MVDRNQVIVWPVVVLWLAVPLAAPIAHSTYRSAGVIDQRRMQWLGWAAMVATEVAMVAVALSIVADWPHHEGAIALAATGLVPLALAAGTVQRLLARVDRLLTHTVSLAGLTAVIVMAYLLALAAFGRRPNGSERTLLLLSMVAAAGAAIVYQPARGWLTDRANRVVYGERVSPDEALRTWGSRLTRAIPLDELLLQLAETLRKSMQLSSAQIWVGADGQYEVTAMVPHRSVSHYIVGDKERSVVSRSGVSGGTWLDIWLPGLVDSSLVTSTRVAPIAHGGELLGLIVCERPADRACSTRGRSRTHRVRPPGRPGAPRRATRSALQRRPMSAGDDEELRASRARIVAAATPSVATWSATCATGHGDTSSRSR